MSLENQEGQLNCHVIPGVAVSSPATVSNLPHFPRSFDTPISSVSTSQQFSEPWGEASASGLSSCSSFQPHQCVLVLSALTAPLTSRPCQL